MSGSEGIDPATWDSTLVLGPLMHPLHTRHVKRMARSLRNVRVHNFHQNTLKALKELLGAAGLNHPSELGPEHVIRRVSSNEVRSLSTLHHWLEPGELLEGVPSSPVYQVFWANARPDTFAAPPSVLTVSTGKTR